MIKRVSSICLVVLFSTLLFACGSKDKGMDSDMSQKDQGAGTDSSMSDASDISETIKETSASLDEAIANGYAWRDTGKILKKAEAASEEGNADQAQKLAMKASEQIEMAQQQSKEQQDAGPWLF